MTRIFTAAPPLMSPDATDRLVTRHDRHAHVHENQLWLPGLVRQDRLGAVFDDSHLEPDRHQQLFEK